MWHVLHGNEQCHRKNKTDKNKIEMNIMKWSIVL